MSTLDILSLIPLIPLIPASIMWWLPWEDWVFEKAPQKFLNVLAPYFLYAAFAAWHFRSRLGSWAVVGPVLYAWISFIAARAKKYAN